MRMDAFDRVCAALGSQNALADLCGVSPQAVSKWKESGIPARHCRRIEARTGVPAAELCPEVFGPAPTEAAQ